jgi:hypothetical protein
MDGLSQSFLVQRNGVLNRADSAFVSGPLGAELGWFDISGFLKVHGCQ